MEYSIGFPTVAIGFLKTRDQFPELISNIIITPSRVFLTSVESLRMMETLVRA